MAYEALFNLKLKSLTLLAPSGEKQKPVVSIILFGVVNNSRSPQAYLTGILPISQPEEGTPSPRSGLTRNAITHYNVNFPLAFSLAFTLTSRLPGFSAA